ncbi:MAG: SEC-C domain-containing protein [Candidatus Cyclobacteriaceae bacterium M2_1C_046]
MNVFSSLFSKIRDELFPAFRITEHLYNGNNKCYCGSGNKYLHCHLPINNANNKNAYLRTKTFIKSGKTIEKIKIKQKKNYRTNFKPGSINPLNKEGKYVDTDGYQSL